MVQKMLDNGSAYRCFLQKDELDQLRQVSEQKKELFRVPQTYRDLSEKKVQELLDLGKSFTVRLKVPKGETEFTDLVYCLLYTSPSPRDGSISRMPSSA